MLLLLAALAAASPTRLASTFDGACGADPDIAATPDGAWVGCPGGGATDKFTVISTRTWKETSLTACAGATGAAALTIVDGGWAFFTGCADGTVAEIEIGADGVVSSDVTIVADTGTGEPVVGVEADADGAGNFTLHAVLAGQVASFDLPGSASPQLLLTGRTGVEDTAFGSGSLLVVHGGDDVTRVASGAAIATADSLPIDLLDAWPLSTGQFYLADSTNGAVVLLSVTTFSSLATDAQSATAVAVDETEGWMLVGAGPEEALLYSYSSGTIGGSPETVAGATDLAEIATIEGYAFGARSDGAVLVLTDRPWIEIASISPDEAGEGDEVSITFTADIAGEYQVLLGEDLTLSENVVDMGTIEAGVETTVTFEATTQQLVEGENLVWVLVESDDELVGRATTELTFDAAPAAVGVELGFGDQSIEVAFTATEDEDVSSYQIYITTEAFTADAFDSGGPEFEQGAIRSPITVQTEPNQDVTKRIAPLTNGVTYYVGVRTTDANSQESLMSEVKSIMPELTDPAWNVEPGFCGVSGPVPGALGVGVALLALLRRRAGLVAAVAAVGLLATAPAAARERPTRTQNFQARYGLFTPADETVDAAFGGDGSGIFWLEYGWSSRFLEADLGAGLYTWTGSQIGAASGNVSSDDEQMSLVPVTLTATARLDFYDDQPLVPFGRIGADACFFDHTLEVADLSDEAESSVGARYGWHWAAGVGIRLDTLDQAGASKAEALWGIDDTWIVAEYRSTSLAMRDGDETDLSSHELSFGLKFDY